MWGLAKWKLNGARIQNKVSWSFQTNSENKTTKSDLSVFDKISKENILIIVLCGNTKYVSQTLIYSSYSISKHDHFHLKIVVMNFINLYQFGFYFLLKVGFSIIITNKFSGIKLVM